ncbi:MAG TPA: hypothetical protein H9684_07365 [Firmicutes bacterium]|nr:hypothetical protein [Bacillota bacterium]
MNDSSAKSGAAGLTPDQLNALLQFASKRLGTTPEQLAKTVQAGGSDSLASKLPPDKAAKFASISGDQAKMQELLNSPQARQLIQQLMNQKKK